jgi:hypothetical protein
MSTQSTTDPQLFLLDSQNDFQEFALKLAQQARRYIFILSRDLDARVYGTQEFVDTISILARDNRYTEIKILVKNTRELAESSHPLVKLAQRLPSKITLRKLKVEPDNADMGFMICDTQQLLYKADEAAYVGFANFNAATEIKHLRDAFDYVWGYGEPEEYLQTLNI